MMFRSALASLIVLAVVSCRASGRLCFPNGTVGDCQAPVAKGDFGTDAFGWLEVRAEAPQACVLRIGEQLNADGSVNVRPAGTIRGCVVTCEVSRAWTRVPFKADWRNTCGTNGVAVAIALPKEVGVVMPFRYVQQVAGPDGLEMRRVFVHWPMERKVKCPVEDPALRELWDFCQHTMVATSFAGVMVDGDRERIPYEGDIYINMMGQLYGVDGDPELARRSIRHVLKHPTWPTEWKQHAIMCVWEDWRFTGSTALAAECYERLKGEKLMLERARPDGLLPSDKADIVDWPKGERDGYDMGTPCNAVVNAFHFRNLREMADLAKALGKAKDAELFARRAEKVRGRFNGLFYDPVRKLYVDGEGSRHASLHANVAALDFGLVPEDRQAAVVAFVAGRGMACSPYFAQYHLEALCKFGRKDVARRLMTSRGDRSWLGMIDQGATMTMEAWSLRAKPNQDWNHAWGAAPLNILARFFADSAVAGKELTVGEYSADVRRRVVAKLGEALDANGRTAEVSGTVTYSGNGCVFLQNGGDGLKVLSSGPRPAVGDEIRVFGEPSLEGGRVVFVSRKWDRLGAGSVPAARKVSAEDLIDADGSRPGVNGLRVVVEGRAMGVTEGGFAVNVGDVPVNVMVPALPDFLRDCERTHPKVRITGIAELMIDPSVLLGRDGYVMGVKLDVSRGEDVELLPDIAYLAAKRSRTLSLAGLALILMLAAGLVTFAVVVFRQRRGLFRTQTIMAERKRMADDIHDTIEQHLVGAGMLLKINRIQEAQDVLVRAKSEIRDIVWGLKNDDMMRLSPAEMLRKLAHEENTKGIYRVDTRLEGLPVQLDAAQMRDLSLIVRETIGNAVKHGGAKHIAISSDPLGNGGWLLRISNDGAPFDPESAPGAKEGHFGIEGMKQRARRLGATVTIKPRGKGMVLILEKRI